MPESVRSNLRRLLIRPGAIGDFVLSLPALQALQSTYTEIWCAEQNVPVARFLCEARSFGSAGVDRIGVLPCDNTLNRLAEFDEIHSWYGSTNDDFRSAVSGFPFRFYPPLPPALGKHASDFYCEQVGSPLRPFRFGLRRNGFLGLTVIHPFASRAGKRWPMERFQHLAQAFDDSVAWCIGPEESLPGAVQIADLGDLARWLISAKLFIGNDSGITHLAAALGVPTVALFGPTNPGVWAPRGPSVRVISRASMDEISVDEVMRCVGELAMKTSAFS